MTSLKDLKAQHPEWCFSCGAYFTGSAEHHLYCVERRSWDDPMLSALIAAKLEDEAKIAELKDDLKVQIGRSEGKNIIIHELEAKLSAEQAAHAATKEALRKADEALIVTREALGDWIDPSEWFVESQYLAMENSYQSALARQSQRAAQSDAAKEE